MMAKTPVSVVFESLTEKQEEALRLASQHLTSKQIAKELGVAPITIYKRIDAVRAKLDQMPRIEVLRHYRAWCEGYGQTIDDPALLTELPTNRAWNAARPERHYRFEDSFEIDERMPWEGVSSWLRPGIKPSDLGVGGKLLFMMIGAIAILIVAVLSMAFANALMDMI